MVRAGGAINVADGVNYNDRNYLGTFPWLALPWSSYNQGHGTPTPCWPGAVDRRARLVP